ncbi:DegT/DnrJ/EryC1/StrS aminotransferase [Streptomyces lincolnensis]|uniref:DegT/DnrJ/EryC1/StrS aminotransferase n=1 Tax=Streptomyces lincolnensis TaxID=1915 RepID=A0A1B1MPP1_STRLN|nr:DegT/DnrJ/EryC1/StrS family aminotransferase [Streptomyces lincolnensis]ANS70534.1 DegT/DnrJ/EryC1/StrS aminotransferase [Streptomyces lincolnensis]
MALPQLSAPRLAIDGGPPVRDGRTPWPEWPQRADDAPQALLSVLDSGRWAISSPYRGELAERRFAAMFAEYTGTRYCVPTDHGSSALVIALESLGLEHGERVLVPALTWTASATAVLRAGLVPVLVDVDPWTGCVGPDAVDPTVDARALLVVHWACGMADVPALSSVTDPLGMSVIEDAAQAHGARWQGRAAGSLGRLGCFSMQQGKVLTCGEGGAVVTNDDALAPVLEELRADSRRYRPTPREGALELVDTASTMGSNYCLGEFASALLCSQLRLLDRQHAVRNNNYQRLAAALSGVSGVRLLRHRPEQDRLSLYEIPIVFDPLPGDMGNAWVADALSAELGVHVYTPRVPLSRSPLLRPWTKPTVTPLADRFVAVHRGRTYPGAEYLSSHSILLHHSAFLGGERDMDDIAAAVEKVADRIRSRTARPRVGAAPLEVGHE